MSMQEVKEAKMKLASMLLRQGKGLGELLNSLPEEARETALSTIFNSIFPMTCEIIDEGSIRISTAVVKCVGACGMTVPQALSMIKCGMYSDDPLLALDDARQLVLTTNGRKATIRAVRAIKRFTLAENVEVPPVVGEVMDSVLRKTELELV